MKSARPGSDPTRVYAISCEVERSAPRLAFHVAFCGSEVAEDGVDRRRSFTCKPYRGKCSGEVLEMFGWYIVLVVVFHDAEVSLEEA